MQLSELLSYLLDEETTVFVASGNNGNVLSTGITSEVLKQKVSNRYPKIPQDKDCLLAVLPVMSFTVPDKNTINVYVDDPQGEWNIYGSSFRKFTKYPKGYVKATTDSAKWKIYDLGNGTYEASIDKSSKDGLMRYTREVYVNFSVVGNEINYLNAYQVGAGGISDFVDEAEFTRYYPNAMAEISEQFSNL